MKENTNDKLKLVYPELNIIGESYTDNLSFPLTSKNYNTQQETIFRLIYKGIPTSCSDYLRSETGYNTDDAAVLTFGIHHQKNSLGSRLVTTK